MSLPLSPLIDSKPPCRNLEPGLEYLQARNPLRSSERKGDAQKNATALPDNANASDRAGSEDESMSKDASVQDNSMMSTDNLDSTMSTSLPSRTSVLQACTSTSILIAALGVTIRQV